MRARKHRENFKLDPKVADTLAKVSKHTNRTKTSIVEMALRDYFPKIIAKELS